MGNATFNLQDSSGVMPLRALEFYPLTGVRVLLSKPLSVKLTEGGYRDSEHGANGIIAGGINNPRT